MDYLTTELIGGFWLLCIFGIIIIFYKFVIEIKCPPLPTTGLCMDFEIRSSIESDSGTIYLIELLPYNKFVIARFNKDSDSDRLLADFEQATIHLIEKGNDYV